MLIRPLRLLAGVLFLASVSLFAADPAHAQTGTIAGQVLNEKTDTPLPGTNVALRGERLDEVRGTSTGSSGRYRLEHVPAGTYEMTFSVVGYDRDERTVTVAPGETVRLDVRLSPTALGLSEVVVSATRGAEQLRSVPTSISVVAPQALETQTSLTGDLGDILAQTVPGLAQSTGTLSNYGQTLRGRNLFVLIDGVPQSTPLRNGLRSLRSINPSAIERVEVIRGASALYGYGATGGAINIVTKRAEEGAVNAFAEAGARFSTQEVGSSLSEHGQLRVSGRSGAFDYLASGSYEDWGYFFDGQGDLVPQDPQGQGGLAGADEYNVLLKGGVQLAEAQRVEASFNYYDFKQNIEYVTVPGTAGEQKSSADEVEDAPGKDPGTENLIATLRYEHADLLGSSLSVRALLQDFKTRFGYAEYYPGGGQGFIRSDKLGARLDIETPLGFTEGTPLAGSTLRWGADVLRDETAQPLEDGRTYVPPIQQTSAAPFAQLKLPLAERAVVRGGARYEAFRLAVDDFTTLHGQSEVEGGTLNYDAFVFNAGGVFFLSDAAEVFASFSQGFSVADVGRTLRSYGEGRDAETTSVEALGPEAIKVNGYEVGARLSTALADASLTGFINTSDLGASYVGDYPNIRLSRAAERIRGVEATLDVRPLEKVEVGGTFTYLEGKRDTDDGNGYESFLGGSRIPPLKVTGYAAYTPIDGWNARVQLLHSGARDRFEAQEDGTYAYGQAPVDAYTTVDLQTALDLGTLGAGRGTIQVGVENLFDTFYFPPVSQWVGSGTSYAAAPGRRVSVSYSISL